MNKSTKTFYKTLQRDIPALRDKLIDCVETLGPDQDTLNKVATEKIEFKDTSSVTLNVKDILTGTPYYKDYKKYNEVATLVNVIKNGSCFNEFYMLDDVMNRYSVTSQDKTYITANLLGICIREFLQLRDLLEKCMPYATLDYEEYKWYVAKMALESKINNLEINDEILNYFHGFAVDDEVRTVFIRENNMYLKLKDYISEDGTIVPCENPSIIKELLSETTLKIPEHLIDSIVSESKKLYDNNIIQKQEAAKRDFELAKARYDATVLEKRNLEKAAANLKEANKAKRELRKYLVCDEPQRYLSRDEIYVVNDLLIRAGYSDERIMKIQRAIFKLNEKYLKELHDEQIKNARARYLLPSEISIINSASSILSDEKSTRNFVYDKIAETFDLINNQLLMFANALDEEDLALNEDAEILLLLIEELNRYVVMYGYSDYQSLLLKKEETRD